MTRWKPFDMMLPATLGPREVLVRVYEQVRLNATEAGDFVHEIRTEPGEAPREGWLKWSVSYLPGPPAPFPTVPHRISGGSAE